MRIFEVTLPPTYLCSKGEHAIGSTVERSHACDLGTGPELALERVRPDSALPRDRSLQLHANAEQDGQYVYLVRPIGQLDRFHSSWLKKLAGTSIMHRSEIDHYAGGFWSGEFLPEDRKAPWEYRAAQAKVLRRVGGSAVWSDGPSQDLSENPRAPEAEVREQEMLALAKPLGEGKSEHHDLGALAKDLTRDDEREEEAAYQVRGILMNLSGTAYETANNIITDVASATVKHLLGL